MPRCQLRAQSADTAGTDDGQTQCLAFDVVLPRYAAAGRRRTAPRAAGSATVCFDQLCSLAKGQGGYKLRARAHSMWNRCRGEIKRRLLLFDAGGVDDLLPAFHFFAQIATKILR